MSSFPMIAPDGSIGDVPAEHVHDAISKGAKLGYELTAPDGTTGIVPADRVHDAIAAGAMLKGAPPPTNVPESAALQNPQNLTQQGQQLQQAAREDANTPWYKPGQSMSDISHSSAEELGKSAEMAIPAGAAKTAVVAGAERAAPYLQLPSKVEASRKTAGATLGAIKSAIPNAVVDTTKATETALQAKELAAGGQTLPQVLGKFLDRMGLGESVGASGGAIPNKPLTFSEGRAVGKTAGKLSVTESLSATDEMKGYISKFAGEVGDALKQTAKEHGFEPQYSQALKDYHAAKTVQEVQAAIKKWGIAAILGGLGTTGAAYLAKQGWRLGEAVNPSK